MRMAVRDGSRLAFGSEGLKTVILLFTRLSFAEEVRRRTPVLALAPMQDVTDLPFWRLMARYGGPDLYYTEYFRVHVTSRLESWIRESVVSNPTGRPAIAQMIGNDIPSLVRTARELMQLPVAAIDLNLGCPAPIVYRKCAGGGLLREPAKVDAILGALREAVPIPLTVKTRLGFESPALFDTFLEIFARHDIDLLTVHARTVYEGYRSEVHYEYIARAVERLSCPVLANGNIYSAAKGASVIAQTQAAGLMIGRGAIRNPWIFEQIRAHLGGQPLVFPKGKDVLHYVRELFDATRPGDVKPEAQVEKMKKYMNFIGLGVDPTGQFLHQIRRSSSEVEFFSICQRFLDHEDPMPLEPFRLELGPRDVMAWEHL